MNQDAERRHLLAGMLESLLRARERGAQAVAEAAADAMPLLPVGHPVRRILSAVARAASEGRELDINAALGRLNGLLADRIDRSDQLMALADAVRADQGVALRCAESVLRYDRKLAPDAVQNHLESLLVMIRLGDTIDLGRGVVRASRSRAADLGRDEGARARRLQLHECEVSFSNDDEASDIDAAVSAARRAVRAYLRRPVSGLARRVLRVCWRAARDGEPRLTGAELARRTRSVSRTNVSRIRAAMLRELAILYRRELCRSEDAELESEA